MIAYSMFGTNDLPKALEFYDALLGSIGVKRMFTAPHGSQFYGKGGGQPMLVVGPPYDGSAASVGNGVMVALGFDTVEEVDSFYAKALELGATSDGEPGWRIENFFYGAYFRDGDGNKICACRMGAAT